MPKFPICPLLRAPMPGTKLILIFLRVSFAIWYVTSLTFWKRQENIRVKWINSMQFSLCLMKYASKMCWRYQYQFSLGVVNSSKKNEHYARRCKISNIPRDVAIYHMHSCFPSDSILRKMNNCFGYNSYNWRNE